MTAPKIPPVSQAAWTKQELQRFFTTARRVLQTAEFDVRITPKMRDTMRLLIVTSRKTGKAHTRNKFRRRIKEVARVLALSRFAYDWGIFAKPCVSHESCKSSIDTLTFAEIKARFELLIAELAKRQQV